MPCWLHARHWGRSYIALPYNPGRPVQAANPPSATSPRRRRKGVLGHCGYAGTTSLYFPMWGIHVSRGQNVFKNSAWKSKGNHFPTKYKLSFAMENEQPLNQNGLCWYEILVSIHKAFFPLSIHFWQIKQIVMPNTYKDSRDAPPLNSI